jgi:hypothetical protein
MNATVTLPKTTTGKIQSSERRIPAIDGQRRYSVMLVMTKLGSRLADKVAVRRESAYSASMAA